MCVYSQKSPAHYIIRYIIAFSIQFFREQGSSDFPKCFLLDMFNKNLFITIKTRAKPVLFQQF